MNETLKMRTVFSVVFIFIFTSSLGWQTNNSLHSANTMISQGDNAQLIPGIAASEIHDSISLTNNSQLESQAIAEEWPGNGTADNPYIIENYIISGPTSAIHLVNIDKYVVVRNVLLQSTAVYSGQGFQLVKCENIKIENSEFKYWGQSVLISDSRKCELEDNLIIDGMYGVQVDDSRFLSIQGNSFEKLQMIMQFTNVSESDISRNIVSDPSSAPIFLMVDSKEITIFENTIQNSESGIAIILSLCQDFEISYNYIENFSQAIGLYGSSNNILTKNTFKNCDIAILLQDSTSNIIYWNNFIEIVSKPTINPDSVTNLWSYEKIGNYWSDKPANQSTYLVWELEPIQIFDEYPFNRPIDITFPSIIAQPSSIQYRKLLDDAPQLNWTVTDENPAILEINLNGSLYNTTTWTNSPMEMILPNLDVGNYTMDFTFYDIDNNTVSFQVKIEVTSSLVSNVADFAIENKWYLIGGGGGLLVITIVGIVLKTKKK
ncbi:hypothetical protein NEF87_003704 [Candidatus Lokiarchaeum ossiferum]|uniref:Periplasmic copper-binding protein NosD beta helix domain-containing protein n=1 Tax=Candidatus Lokiarchaeum ossiferum TaxID=2951803 RepID=A0ABY6HXY7_9ARCH|nr:hypothetical protein NEF87_003704 [Candidatus Lokiarchaeum sp. B-35]